MALELTVKLSESGLGEGITGQDVAECGGCRANSSSDHYHGQEGQYVLLHSINIIK